MKLQKTEGLFLAESSVEDLSEESISEMTDGTSLRETTDGHPLVPAKSGFADAEKTPVDRPVLEGPRPLWPGDRIRCVFVEPDEVHVTFERNGEILIPARLLEDGEDSAYFREGTKHIVIKPKVFNPDGIARTLRDEVGIDVELDLCVHDTVSASADYDALSDPCPWHRPDWLVEKGECRIDVESY